MTAAITISCDGSWDSGRMPCRANLPTATGSLDDAVDLALLIGWSTRLVEVGGDELESHLCPACTRLGVAW